MALMVPVAPVGQGVQSDQSAQQFLVPQVHQSSLSDQAHQILPLALLVPAILGVHLFHPALAVRGYQVALWPLSLALL